MSSLSGLLLHPKTEKQAKLYLLKPLSPLLILGGRGSGKLKLALSITRDALALKPEKELSNHPYFVYVKRADGKQDISINAVREITRLLRLKTPGKASVRRVVLIEEAQFLSDEAQNALLKILEEPNDDTLSILTAPNELSLLPTIVSRCQIVWAHPVSFEHAKRHYADQVTQKKLGSAWRLSQGNASLLGALLSEDDSHPLKMAIAQTKEFLGKSKYQRLLDLDKLGRNKEELEIFLEALSKILTALHRSAIEKNRPKQALKLAADRKLVNAAQEALNENANTRLLCLSLVLNLNS